MIIHPSELHDWISNWLLLFLVPVHLKGTKTDPIIGASKKSTDDVLQASIDVIWLLKL
jgi:hypothetical protein